MSDERCHVREAREHGGPDGVDPEVWQLGHELVEDGSGLVDPSTVGQDVGLGGTKGGKVGVLSRSLSNEVNEFGFAPGEFADNKQEAGVEGERVGLACVERKLQGGVCVPLRSH